ncbi:MAG: ABC transporter ATP-binding protein, partial [Pseudomonadota bacterium]
YALFPNMSVAQNIAYGPKLQGFSRAERAKKAERYMSLCRILPLAERRIDQLSGGQRQRVALARALAAEPRAIFLDEPLTALDAALRETLRDEIAEVLASLQITAVYVTHDQAEAMALADRIVVMNEGQIVQIGPPREIYEHPRTRFVAQFVGETNRRTGPDGTLELYRPEAVRLVPAGEGIAATVEGATYLGPVTRLSLATAHGPVRALDHTGRRFEKGDALGLVIDGQPFTFPDEPDAPCP